MDDTSGAIDLRVTGLVQGVGFRPFVYRLATELGLSGSVRNQTDGVLIHAVGSRHALDAFVERLPAEAPPAADIDSVTVTPVDAATADGSEHAAAGEPAAAGAFVINQSADLPGEITRISPDLPVCDDCLADMGLFALGGGRRQRPIQSNRRPQPRQPQRRRLHYPFTNCTNCGPRFSIVQGLPYDRAKTSMAGFQMCEDCRSEYEDVADRRFHAQPVSCSRCGPRYSLAGTVALPHGAGSRVTSGSPEAADEHAPPAHEALTDRLARALEAGRIVAVKGVGGFHLGCDATNERAVAELRRRKHRDGKPFAVMFSDADAASECARLTPRERELLESSARPIVLLRAGDTGAPPRLAPSVANGLSTIGAFLPYTPLHHLLFERLAINALVMTSGNLSREPIVIDNTEASSRLGDIADILLTHNREIVNRQDDSVCMVVNDRPRVLRRSRGYVPSPVALAFSADGVIAFGAEQKNTLCFGRGSEAILSQHIGDVDNPETVDFLTEVLDRFPDLFRITPRLAVTDRHPDYLSSQVAERLGVPVVRVGHHHAHVASCMAEHGLEGTVLGIALDGTGFGDDGTIWGGEFLLGGFHGYERFAHFDPVPMPGGDLAAEQPWRSGLSYLLRAFGPEGPPAELRAKLSIFDGTQVTPEEREAALIAVTRGINAPLASSAGRLFDAVASICGICTHATFDAEAPIRLTDLLASGPEDARAAAYPFSVSGESTGPRRVLFEEMIRQIARDVAAGESVRLISERFHTTILNVIVTIASMVRDERAVNRVALSGGVFQNWFLLEGAERELAARGFEVFSHAAVPSNDGGLALGQLAVAAARHPAVQHGGARS